MKKTPQSAQSAASSPSRGASRCGGTRVLFRITKNTNICLIPTQKVIGNRGEIT